VYPVIGNPPVDTGSFHVKFTFPDESVFTVMPVGVPGTVVNVTELETAPLDVPNAFLAYTVNVYATPGVNPVNLWENEPINTLFVVVGGVDIATYPVMGNPSLITIGSQVTMTFPEEIVAFTLVGGLGTLV